MDQFETGLVIDAVAMIVAMVLVSCWLDARRNARSNREWFKRKAEELRDCTEMLRDCAPGVPHLEALQAADEAGELDLLAGRDCKGRARTN